MPHYIAALHGVIYDGSLKWTHVAYFYPNNAFILFILALVCISDPFQLNAMEEVV